MDPVPGSSGVHWSSVPRSPLPGLPLKKARIFEGSTPRELFTHHASEHTVLRCHPDAHRLVRRGDDREMLIYVDGSCLDQNDATNVDIRRAGCAWVFKPEPYAFDQRSVAIRLELEGPDGQQYPQTSNRAELRAALGALRFRAWDGEGYHRVVIASDSEYLVLGITEWIENWADNGWRTGSGDAVKNEDLWKALLERINHFAKIGLEVLFWRIPRELNGEADQAAKAAAQNEPAVVKFSNLRGALV
ncbi:uncharacterized protein RCC_03864 [Ramularia collo-cygni]|uniref:ribonuclease H n=1 Tax=Ramularia collo-cygni TaxID=112498 RepID=A0A2D3V3B6_9PEZI|nr:uncharacterized protein RCC_03864 [Ramularia collo-cygni]CZT18026.1 uncharacterized protein RCC_03864 [Ramularia collo-cygni]